MPQSSLAKRRVGKAPIVRMTSPSGVSYSLEEVTPDRAELWLGSNFGNRRKKDAKLAGYARDMTAGSWSENGSSIVFDENGDLIDGQNRLEACVLSGRPFTTLIVRGAKRSVQQTIDGGAARTLADRFTFAGVKNATVAASVTRRIILWRAGFKTNTGTYQPTTREALDLIDADPTVATAVEMAVSMRSGKLLPPSIVGLSWWLFWGIDSDDCQEFWSGLHTGAGLAPESPILVLRNQIVRKAAEPGRIPESVILAWVIKAWNDWRGGRERVRPYNLRPGDPFPEPK